MKENITEEERFFSKVSHDLRGSFTSILGFSDIISDPDEDLSIQEMKDYVSRIAKQSHDTYELLVNFINWLKLEKYDYGLTFEEIELIDVLYEIKELHKQKFVNKDISLNIEIDEILKVYMDYEILSSIFSNVFLFLINVCTNESKITVKTIEIRELVYLELVTELKNDSTVLNNLDLKDLNNELSFPIIFAIKFTELCKGKFSLNIKDSGDVSILIGLPYK